MEARRLSGSACLVALACFSVLLIAMEQSYEGAVGTALTALRTRRQHRHVYNLNKRSGGADGAASTAAAAPPRAAAVPSMAVDGRPHLLVEAVQAVRKQQRAARQRSVQHRSSTQPYISSDCRLGAEKLPNGTTTCAIADQRWPDIHWLPNEERWSLPSCRPDAGPEHGGNSTRIFAAAPHPLRCPAANAACEAGSPADDLHASCFYRGRCGRNGVCVCEKGYTGAQCTEWQLQLQLPSDLTVSRWLIGWCDFPLVFHWLQADFRLILLYFDA